MSFNNVIGHTSQIDILKRAISKRRIAHAYLFVGPEGIGKRLVAKIFAKSLNCMAGTLDSCNSCISCRKIDDSNHPDIHVIEPTGNYIKIGQIREIQSILCYKPYEGSFRVIIIDRANTLHLSAANALLKALEEPPPYTIFILISPTLEQILPTIISRCQKIVFSPLKNKEIEDILVKSKEFDASTAQIVASLSEGSLRKAYMLDKEFLSKIRPKLIEQICKLSLSNIDEIFGLSEKMIKEYEDLTQVLEILKTWFRDLLIFRESPLEKNMVNIDLIDKIKYYSHQIPSDALFENINALNQAQSALLMNANRQLTLDSLFITICCNK